MVSDKKIFKVFFIHCSAVINVAYNAETVITRFGLGSCFFPHQFESVALFPRNAAV